MTPSLYVGTIGMSVWFSADLGETWLRPNSEHGMSNEARVWGMAAHPGRPDSVLAATDRGLHRWSERDSAWTHVPTPMDGLHLWAVQIAPDDPDLIIVGVSPGALWRSSDGGVSWRRLDLAIPTTCLFNVTSRVTQILFDPLDPNIVWASVEIDAIWRSRDRGLTWTRVNGGMPTDDVHGIAVRAAGGRRQLFAATNRGLFVSDDDGEHFRQVTVDTPRQYFRAVACFSDGSMLVTNGDGPPGSWGRVYRSEDGESWSPSQLDSETNSTLWTIAIHGADPRLVFVCSNLGQIFRSTDGGRSFSKLRRELGEIRSSTWRPV